VKIARSGRVWEFIEGEDFTGKASSFRARAKTAARKLGVDFDSAEVKRGDKTVLKVLAHLMSGEQRAQASASADAGSDADAAAPSASAEVPAAGAATLA
jgi:hypothetical protein